MPTAKIMQDNDAESPRSWSNFGTMACWHNRYNFGDVQPKISPVEWLRQNAPHGSIVLSLYLLDHSGISMSTKPFSDPWDSGRVGLIVCTPDKIREHCQVKRISKQVRAKVTNYLEQEVDIYNKYLNNECYGFQITNDDGTDGDSCWGFIGDDLEGMIANAGEECRACLTEAWGKRFD